MIVLIEKRLLQLLEAASFLVLKTYPKYLQPKVYSLFKNYLPLLWILYGIAEG